MPGKSKFKFNKRSPSAAGAAAGAGAGAGAKPAAEAKAKPENVEAVLIDTINLVTKRFFEVAAILNTLLQPKSVAHKADAIDVKQVENNNAWELVQTRYSLEILVIFSMEALFQFMRRWSNKTKRNDWKKEQQACNTLRNQTKHILATLPDREFFAFIKALVPIQYQMVTTLTYYSNPQRPIISDEDSRILISSIDLSAVSYTSLSKFLENFNILNKKAVQGFKQELTHCEFYNFVLADRIPLLNFLFQPVLQQTDSKSDVVMYDYNRRAAICEVINDFSVYYTEDRRRIFENFNHPDNPLRDEKVEFKNNFVNFLFKCKKAVSNKIGHETPKAMRANEVPSAAVSENEFKQIGLLALKINPHKFKNPNESRYLRQRVSQVLAADDKDAEAKNEPESSSNAAFAPAAAAAGLQAPCMQVVSDPKKDDVKVASYSYQELKAAAMVLKFTDVSSAQIKKEKLPEDLLHDITHVIVDRQSVIPTEQLMRHLNRKSSDEFIRINFEEICNRCANAKHDKKQVKKNIVIEIFVRVLRGIEETHHDNKKIKFLLDFLTTLKNLKEVFGKIVGVSAGEYSEIKLKELLEHADVLIKVLLPLKSEILEKGFRFEWLEDEVTLDVITKPCLIIHSEIKQNKLFDLGEKGGWGEFVSTHRKIPYLKDATKKLKKMNLAFIEDPEFLAKYMLGKLVLCAENLENDWPNVRKAILKKLPKPPLDIKADQKKENSALAANQVQTDKNAKAPEHSAADDAKKAGKDAVLVKEISPLFSHAEIAKRLDLVPIELCKNLKAEFDQIIDFINKNTDLSRKQLRGWYNKNKELLKNNVSAEYADVVLNLSKQWSAHANDPDKNVAIKAAAECIAQILSKKAENHMSLAAVSLKMAADYTHSSAVSENALSGKKLRQAAVKIDAQNFRAMAIVAQREGFIDEKGATSKKTALYFAIEKSCYRNAQDLVDSGADMLMDCGSDDKAVPNTPLTLLQDHVSQKRPGAAELLSYWHNKTAQKPAIKLENHTQNVLPNNQFNFFKKQLKTKQRRFLTESMDSFAFNYEDLLPINTQADKNADQLKSKTTATLPKVVDTELSAQLPALVREKIITGAEQLLREIKNQKYTDALQLLIGFAEQEVMGDNLFNLILKAPLQDKQINVKDFIMAGIVSCPESKAFEDNLKVLCYFKEKEPKGNTRFYTDMKKNIQRDNGKVENTLALLMGFTNNGHEALFNSVLNEKGGLLSLWTVRQLLKMQGRELTASTLNRIQLSCIEFPSSLQLPAKLNRP